MNNFIEQSKIKYQYALSSYQRAKVEHQLQDFLLRDVAFNLQQTLEFQLKGIISLFEEPTYGHDFTPILNQIYSLQIEVSKLKSFTPFIEEIVKHQMEISRWEVKSRYDPEYYVMMQTIEEIIPLCEDINNYIGQLCKEV